MFGDHTVQVDASTRGAISIAAALAGDHHPPACPSQAAWEFTSTVRSASSRGRRGSAPRTVPAQYTGVRVLVLIASLPKLAAVLGCRSRPPPRNDLATSAPAIGLWIERRDPAELAALMSEVLHRGRWLSIEAIAELAAANSATRTCSRKRTREPRRLATVTPGEKERRM
jgi:hypothetical protein